MNESSQHETSSNPIIPEVMPAETAVARHLIPTTLDELASLPEEQGLAIVETRHKIVESLRRASVALTSPQDWLLFRAEDRITAYLQDSGCGRIMPLWGIDITPTDKPETITMTDDANGDFAIRTFGDAYCGATNAALKGVEGVRYSTEDFCRDLAPIQKKVRVTQASTANRNGNAVRRLTGLQNTAIEFIEDVWKGTGKSIALCPHGKGFGSKADRQGAGGVSAGTPKDVPAPVCEKCQKTMKFISGEGKTYASFWSCPDKKKVDGQWNDHSSVNDKQYREGLAKSAPRDPGQEG